MPSLGDQLSWEGYQCEMTLCSEVTVTDVAGPGKNRKGIIFLFTSIPQAASGVKILSPSKPECLSAKRQPGSLKLLLCTGVVSHP